ncbi:MAG: hypothetical protein ACWGOV_01490 [Acidiferrobacterales bacterium]
MDEDNYRSTYREFNDLPCLFEKAVLQRCCKCHLARHFNLAERVGVACSTMAAQEQCREFLSVMKDKSIFALQLTPTEDGKLPHAKKIKIQCGGVNGLQLLDESNDMNKDVNRLLNNAVEHFGSLDQLPFEQIVRSVVSFEGRKRRKK